MAPRKRPRAATGTDALSWLLGAEVSPALFFEEHWEKKPLFVRRDNSRY